MTLLRILLNGFIMLAELAAVAAVAWAGYQHPFLFAAGTAGLSLLLGLRMEAARLRNELPFYFGVASRYRGLLVPFVAFAEALLKAIMAGIAALFTFAGTDTNRLFWVAVLFGFVVFAGSSVLRILSIRLDGIPLRWGFFRLGPPLGLLFSAGLALLAALALVPQTSLSDIGWKMVWDLPAKPSLEQVSELLFQLKQAFDDFIVTVLAAFLREDMARAAGVLVSVNVLTGFVASVYAAVIATLVRRAERRLP